jgi:hypothetical protein
VLLQCSEALEQCAEQRLLGPISSEDERRLTDLQQMLLGLLSPQTFRQTQAAPEPKPKGEKGRFGPLHSTFHKSRAKVRPQ